MRSGPEEFEGIHYDIGILKHRIFVIQQHLNSGRKSAGAQLVKRPGVSFDEKLGVRLPSMVPYVARDYLDVFVVR